MLECNALVVLRPDTRAIILDLDALKALVLETDLYVEACVR